MKLAIALFERFGLFARKDSQPDQFDLRLDRIGKRERRLEVRPVLFRNQPAPREA